MLRTNRDKLVKISVVGEVVSPVVGSAIYKVSAEGEPVILPGGGASPTTSGWGTLPAAGWRTMSSRG